MRALSRCGKGKRYPFTMLSNWGRNPLNASRLNDLALALSPRVTEDEGRSTDERGADCTGGSTWASFEATTDLQDRVTSRRRCGAQSRELKGNIVRAMFPFISGQRAKVPGLAAHTTKVVSKFQLMLYRSIARYYTAVPLQHASTGHRALPYLGSQPSRDGKIGGLNWPAPAATRPGMVFRIRFAALNHQHRADAVQAVRHLARMPRDVRHQECADCLPARTAFALTQWPRPSVVHASSIGCSGRTPYAVATCSSSAAIAHL